MKLVFILITIFISFLKLTYIKSEEKTETPIIKKEYTFKEEFTEDKNSEIENVHIVKVGDTISSISKLYSIEKELLIKLNNLKDENYIYVGQNLIISNKNKESDEKTILDNQINKNFHFVQAGETLTEIANKYKLNLQYLIEINNLENPNSIEVGNKIALNQDNQISEEGYSILNKNETKKSKNIYKTIYGPLTVQSNKLKKFKKRQILEVRNQTGKKLILSLNCEKQEIDVRIPGRKWRGWQPAEENFEKDLINDLC